MQNLTIDTGVQEYKINGGAVLRFNPTDPNLYGRFMEVQTKLEKMEQELVRKGQELENSGDNVGKAIIDAMGEADRGVKALLTEAFGAENDFDALLGGVNLMAVATNGERVVTNLLAALAPIITEGVNQYAAQKTGAAVAEAKANRAQRRAAAKH